jgi:proton-translocating NAD(P)+ transhydrogenase subunit alpha
MRIGIPKEILVEEKRVAATPETVKKYVKMGFTVTVQTAAGEGIYVSDEDYRKAGAEVVPGAEEVFATSDVILKVKQPVFNANAQKHEAEMLREGSILITFLHPAAPANHPLVLMLQERNITSFTMDGIPRISRAQRMDALTSMSTVTGYRSVVIAANHLSKFVPMIGTAIGTVKPAAFLIVGAGVVGLQAAATAKRLGGVVKVVDIREEARKEAASLGAKVAGFEVPPELALGEGGYAKALSESWLKKEREALEPLVKEADVLILSALVPGEIAPVLITQQMLEAMNQGSVIVDVSIDQGGNCELTKLGCFTEQKGVSLCGIANIPGQMAVPASWLYANNMYYYVENLFKKGLDRPDLEDDIVKHSLVTHRRKIFFEGALKALKAA